MKGTIFAVALNHRSQLDAWRDAFQQAPYKTPPKTAVWFTNLAIPSSVPARQFPIRRVKPCRAAQPSR